MNQYIMLKSDWLFACVCILMLVAAHSSRLKKIGHEGSMLIKNISE